MTECAVSRTLASKQNVWSNVNNGLVKTLLFVLKCCYVVIFVTAILFFISEKCIH